VWPHLHVESGDLPRARHFFSFCSICLVFNFIYNFASTFKLSVASSYQSVSYYSLFSLSLLFLVSKVKSIFIIVFSRYFYWSFFKWQFLKHCGCFHYDYLFVFQFLTFLKCLDRFHFAARFGPVFCCTT